MASYIVILNWNGWQDTLSCLESVFAQQHKNFRVIVCDNGSTDDSLSRITAWAEGREQAPGNAGSLARLTRKTRAAVPFVQLGCDELATPVTTPLTLLDNGANLGFAAGNNTGIRLALAQPDMTHVWLLNNDTVIEPDALTRLESRMAGDPLIGCCGSLIKFFDDPTVIQAVGGCSFNSLTGIASPTLGRYLPDTTPIDQARFEHAMDYVSGASMLLSREFLEQIGLMEESYFLYYEEIDWAIRAVGKFCLAIAKDSVVYHKEGSAIGSASFARGPSATSEFYLFRAKMRFMRRHRHRWLPVAWITSFAQALNRLRRGKTRNGLTILRLLLTRQWATSA